MVISSLADGITRSVESLSETVSETFFEPVIRLGVTGLARAGKTVFITSLIANMMNRARMSGLVAQHEGRISTAFLQPQPTDTLPRFDYEAHLGALTGTTPDWPESTRTISELRLSLRVQPKGLLAGLSGPRTVHLDIVDYPGEWLLDLGLLDKSFADWSASTLTKLTSRAEAADYLAQIAATDATAPLEEPQAQALAAGFTAYLNAARQAGYYDCTPGRFLLPGDLAGSPVLTFAPLPRPETVRRSSLWREMERRFDAYKSRVVRPFFREHFARIDRQVVLVDALGAGTLDIARARRAHTARSLIDSTDLTFTEIAYAAGFGSVRQFNATMRAVYGVTPSELRGSRRRPGASPSMDATGTAPTTTSASVIASSIVPALE